MAVQCGRRPQSPINDYNIAALYCPCNCSSQKMHSINVALQTWNLVTHFQWLHPCDWLYNSPQSMHAFDTCIDNLQWKHRTYKWSSSEQCELVLSFSLMQSNANFVCVLQVVCSSVKSIVTGVLWISHFWKVFGCKHIQFRSSMSYIFTCIQMCVLLIDERN